MLPTSSSEEDIGLAISTDEDGKGPSTPSRMATVSRARGKRYLSCPALVHDSASSDSASSSSTPEGGNSPVSSPYSTPYSTPPKTRPRGPPSQPPPAGPLPPIPYPKPMAAKSLPAIPKIQVSVTPNPPVPASEELFRLYNPSRSRFQAALDQVHDSVWHGSIRETKREHVARDASLSSLNSEDTRSILVRRTRVDLPSSNSVDDDMAMTSLLSGWSLSSDVQEYVLQDNESGVLDPLDWWNPSAV